MKSATTPHVWLALLHQLPAKPPYLRVKIWGLAAEIIESSGEATLIQATLLLGQTDAELRALFDAARDADYSELAQSAKVLIDTGPASGADIARLQKRLAEIMELDFFGANGRQDAEAALQELDRRRYEHPDIRRSEPAPSGRPVDLKDKTWVTRQGVHVDRIACAWLIRRFIDPKASFKFVEGKSYAPQPGEYRFDMVDAEFTHEEDRCSFETLLLHAGLSGDAALVAIGEMIHELDIADGKFDRPETSGLGAMLFGVCASTGDDLQRIASAGDALNLFHAFFSARKVAP
jgi:hypothetical protein